MEIETVVLFVLVFMIIPFAFIFAFVDVFLEVDPEYINGILTASSIAYGLWGFVISRTEKGMDEYLWIFRIGKVFTILLLLLVFSVFTVFFSGLGVIPSTAALYICMWSFLMNAIAMSYTLAAPYLG